MQNAGTHSFSIGVTEVINTNLLIELSADDVEYVYQRFVLFWAIHFSKFLLFSFTLYLIPCMFSYQHLFASQRAYEGGHYTVNPFIKGFESSGCLVIKWCFHFDI